MTGGKDGVIAQIKSKLQEAIEEIINGISAKTIIDALAVVGFVIGGFALGLGITLDSATWAIPGLSLIVLGVGRLMHNSGGFK